MTTFHRRFLLILPCFALAATTFVLAILLQSEARCVVDTHFRGVEVAVVAACEHRLKLRHRRGVVHANRDIGLSFQSPKSRRRQQHPRLDASYRRDNVGIRVVLILSSVADVLSPFCPALPALQSLYDAAAPLEVMRDRLGTLPSSSVGGVRFG